jgi:molybdate transport system substrate-binding protein
LAHQLAQGAPADLFASADERQMHVATDAGRADPAAIRPFAANRLQVVLPQENRAGIAELNDLAIPGIKLVFADAAAPIGRYTQAMLANTAASTELSDGFEAAVAKNVVSYEQNVRAVLSKIVLDEADAGIVYQSDAIAAGGQLQTIDIPDEINVTTLYPIAPILDSDAAMLAQAFIDFIATAEGQAILQDFGFRPVPTTSE